MPVLLGWPAKIVEFQAFREFISRKAYFASQQGEIRLIEKRCFSIS
jgi:hypothetical protein